MCIILVKREDLDCHLTWVDKALFLCYLTQVIEENIVQKNKGFTLTELLVSASLTLAVATLMGGSLISIMRPVMKNEENISATYESDRLSDYIGMEVAIADTVEPGGVLPPGETGTPVFSIKTGSLVQPITYFVTNKAGQSIWRGSKLLKRFGPKFNSEGKYDTTASWSSEVAIDGLSSEPISHSCKIGETPTDNALTGVTGCINDQKTKIEYTLNRNMKSGSEDFGQYTPNYLAVVKGVKIKQQTSVVGPGAGANSGCNLSLNSISCNQSTTFDFKVIGGDIQCGQNAPGLMPVETFVKFDDGDWNQVNGTQSYEKAPKKLVIRGKAIGNYDCSGNVYQYDSDNDKQVVLLKDGDKVPAVKGFGGQKSAQQFLEPYTKKDEQGNVIVSLPKNQILILMELGVTDTDSDAFDLQDTVVLATLGQDVT